MHTHHATAQHVLVSLWPEDAAALRLTCSQWSSSVGSNMRRLTLSPAAMAAAEHAPGILAWTKCLCVHVGTTSTAAAFGDFENILKRVLMAETAPSALPALSCLTLCSETPGRLVPLSLATLACSSLTSLVLVGDVNSEQLSVALSKLTRLQRLQLLAAAVCNGADDDVATWQLQLLNSSTCNNSSSSSSSDINRNRSRRRCGCTCCCTLHCNKAGAISQEGRLDTQAAGCRLNDRRPGSSSRQLQSDASASVSHHNSSSPPPPTGSGQQMLLAALSRFTPRLQELVLQDGGDAAPTTITAGAAVMQQLPVCLPVLSGALHALTNLALLSAPGSACGQLARQAPCLLLPAVLRTPLTHLTALHCTAQHTHGAQLTQLLK